MNPTPTKLTHSPKYSVGDYLTRDDWVFLHVEAVIPGTQPLYGLSNPRHGGLGWYTEHELTQKKIYTGKPDFDLWSTVQAGDMIHMGIKDQGGYVKVLARVGEAVMLSMSPTSKHDREMFEKITSQIEELTDGNIEVKAVMPDMTTRGAYNSASIDWWLVKSLALQHWTLIREVEE